MRRARSGRALPSSPSWWKECVTDSWFASSQSVEGSFRERVQHSGAIPTYTDPLGPLRGLVPRGVSAVGAGQWARGLPGRRPAG